MMFLSCTKKREVSSKGDGTLTLHLSLLIFLLKAPCRTFHLQVQGLCQKASASGAVVEASNKCTFKEVMLDNVPRYVALYNFHNLFIIPTV